MNKQGYRRSSTIVLNLNVNLLYIYCCITTRSTLLLLVAFHSARSYFLAMVSEGEVHVVNEGETATLECSFHADGYSLFDYPVLWRKTQRGEDTQMNIMGNINEPFASSNRFEVAFTSLAPRYKFELTIADVRQLDSGNYTCEIRGPYSTTLGQTMHHLYVRTPVQSVSIIDTGNGETPVRTIRAVENHPTWISCLVVGGYPPPTIEVNVGRRDVTAEFGVYRTTATLSGRRGLRLMTHRTERRTITGFRPRADDHDARIKCIAGVQGLKAVVEFARLDVDYSPKLKCASVGARVGDESVYLSCDVNAKPPVMSLAWIVDSNGTTVSETHHANGFSARIVDQPNGIIEVQLHIQVVRVSSFRKYTLVAENVIATTTIGVELSENSAAAAAAASAAVIPSNRTATSRDTSRLSYAKMAAADPTSRTSHRLRADRSAASRSVHIAVVSDAMRVLQLCLTLISFTSPSLISRSINVHRFPISVIWWL